MTATGEYIRMTNYVDDIAATLRRILTGSATMTSEEKKRLADYMRQVDPNYAAVLQQLEAGK
jgi:histidine ammonia-lyase